MTTIRQHRAHEAGFTLAELLVTMAISGLFLTAVLGIYTVMQRSTLFATAGEDAQSVTRSTLDGLLTNLRLINAGRSVPTGAITAASATSITFLGDVDNDTVDAVTGNDATLTVAANVGDITVRVSSATGFTAGLERFSIANAGTSETQAINAIAGTTLTLGAPLANAYPAGSIVRSVETVTYALDPATGALCRNVGGPCLAPFANNLVVAILLPPLPLLNPPVPNPPGFQLTYWDAASNPIPIVNLGTQAGRDTVRQIRVTIISQAQMGDRTVARTMTASVRPRNF